MDIYVEKVNTVEFEAPTGATGVSATYSFNGSTATALTVTPASDADVYDATLPYIDSEGDVEVDWTFTIGGTTYTKVQKYNVVTPYLSTRWIKKNLMENATDDQIAEAEASARFIINAHTGQNFGKYVATKTVYVKEDTNSLMLPDRALTISTLNSATFNTAVYTLDGDGWYLSRIPRGYPPVRADDDGVFEVNGAVHNPISWQRTWYAFSKGDKFDINATWGWDEVPTEVTEAMKLLVNDYASGDSMYRDRYLVSIQSANDWTMEFSNGAYAKTGNVRADQLLSDFVLKRGWAVF